MLIFKGIAPLDVAGPMQVFALANLLTQRPLYELLTVAPTAEAVPTGLGFALQPACAMTDLPSPIDTLLVSGGALPQLVMDPAISHWLAATAPNARRFGSVCTGAFFLGDAGLIDGKRVTTHWAAAPELARRHPTAQVELDSIYVRDGKVCSSAGITAGIDLALALLEEDHGRGLALKVARYLVLFLKRSGGQAQFSTHLQAQFSAVPAIQQVQVWCQDNLDSDLRVPALARRAAMSERNFVRTFRASAGRSPGEFILETRLQAARRMLEEGDLPLKTVAERCGFGSAAAIRRMFERHLGVSPADYRERFRAHDIAAE
jgi:transcriptional regulator GlxA family with amidase domain